MVRTFLHKNPQQHILKKFFLFLSFFKLVHIHLAHLADSAGNTFSAVLCAALSFVSVCLIIHTILLQVFFPLICYYFYLPCGSVFRVRLSGMKIMRPPLAIGHYKMIKHKGDQGNEQNPRR